MFIYFSEHSLDEGFQILSLPMDDRLSKGKPISRPSGWNLFSAMQGSPIKCWHCGCEADRWVSVLHRKDVKSNPVLNLFCIGTDFDHSGQLVMMTRDHIIPKSLGGTDDIKNLRPGCGPCNELRSNEIGDDIIQFAKENPNLISQQRISKGLESLKNHVESLRRNGKQNQAEIDRIEKPFRDMGYL